MARRPGTTSTALPTGDTTVGDTTVGDPAPAPAPPAVPVVEKPGPVNAAELAAARRAARSTAPAPHPTGAAPAPVDGVAPVSVIASQTTVSGFGSGGPARPVGGVWAGRPLVLETSPNAVGGVIPDDPIYVVADCDAQIQTIPPNCVTPVSRTLWHRGMRVRRDLYEAVMAEHAERAAAGTAGEPFDAALPAESDVVPVDTLAAGVRVNAVQPGATAGTTVATPIVVPTDGHGTAGTITGEHPV